MFEESKKSYRIRLAPCSHYDVGRFESWLEDMAQEGYVLEKIFLHVGIFTKGQPRRLRYRICELPQESLYADRSPSGEDELIAICEASGWRYVDQRLGFGIFVTEDDALPELQTEPYIAYDKALWMMAYGLLFALLSEILILCLDWRWYLGIMVVLLLPFLYWQRKKQIPRMLNEFMIIIILMMPNIAQPLNLFTRHGFLITWVNEGSGVFLSAMLGTVFFLFFFLFVIAGPFKYCLRMQRGLPFDHKQNWRRKAPVYWATTMFVVVALCYIFMTMFGGCTAKGPDASLQRWENYSGEIPFAVMEDFVPQPAQLEVWNDSAKLEFDQLRQRTRDVPNIFYNWRVNGSHVEEKPDWVAPQALYVQQEGLLQLADGQQLQGSLSVTYYEMRWPWMARELAREYESMAKERLGDDYQLLTLPELDVDYALAYQDRKQAVSYPRLILVDGNRMAKVYFYQGDDGYTVPLEQWSAIFAEQFGE